MKRGLILLALLVPALAGCIRDRIAPSPTADQVLAAQYRAQGERGAMSGAESQAVMDAYRHGIARSVGAGSVTGMGETNSH